MIDLENFRDVGRMIRTIENGTAQTGKTKGQPWELSSKLDYISAIAAVLRRIRLLASKKFMLSIQNL